MKRKSKWRAWTPAHVRTLKALGRKKTPAARIARTLKRTEGATRQKGFQFGIVVRIAGLRGRKALPH